MGAVELQLNPGNAAGMVHTFDVGCGYHKLNEFCQQELQRPLPEGPFELLQIGIEHMPVLDAEECRKLRNMIDVDSGFLKSRAFRSYVVSKVLTREVDDRLLAYFESEYLALYCRFYKAVPDQPDTYSFGWHCDGGPSKHLKILLYLNGTAEHGGNTEFIDRSTTDAFKSIGYVHCDIRQRLRDLAPLAQEHGIRWNPIQHDMDTGEAVIFEPMNILHRGVWPERAPRYLVQICLIPSPAPWQEMCENFALPGADNDWPPVGENWPAPQLGSMAVAL